MGNIELSSTPFFCGVHVTNLFSFFMCSVSLDYSFFIAQSVLSNVYSLTWRIESRFWHFLTMVLRVSVLPRIIDHRYENHWIHYRYIFNARKLLVVFIYVWLVCLFVWWCLTPLSTIVLLVEETGGPGENHRPVASHWQTLSHNVVL